MTKPVTLIACLLLATAARAQEPKTTATIPPELAGEVQLHQRDATIWDLQKQNAELRAQLAELTARLDSVALNQQGAKLQAERTELEAQIRSSVKAPAGATIDWSKSPPVVTWPKPEDKKGGPKP